MATSSTAPLARYLYEYPLLSVSTPVGDAKALANRAKMLELIGELGTNLEWATGQGKASAQRTHLTRGMLLARDRIAMLLDPGSPWMELCALAGFGWEDSSPAASTVAGIGLVAGVITLITSNVATVDGGAMNEATVIKGGRLGEIGLENRIPSISLVQSAGANLPQQFRVFHKGGSGFR